MIYFHVFAYAFALFLAASHAALCDGLGNLNSNIGLDEFTAFPSPIAVGDTLYIRAKITPAQLIPAGKVQLRVYYSSNPDVSSLNPIINIPGMDLCTISSSVKCPLKPTGNILTWEFVVPSIPQGTYQIKYNILQTVGAGSNYSTCIQFPITVTGEASNTEEFFSWYAATLFGKAYFTQTNYTVRTAGDKLQVGPSGSLVDWDGSKLRYGTLGSLTGSGDLVPSGNFDTSGYVWGLSGVLEKKIYGIPHTKQTHIYKGECYLGHSAAGYTHANPLLSGTFSLNWTYTDEATAHISGQVIFTPNATIPPGWGFPLLFGQLGVHNVITNDAGFLMIKGSSTFCPTGICTTHDSVRPSAGNGLSSDKLGLAIGLPIAFVFVVVVAAAGLIWYMNRRKTEQEDGIFAVAQKPEYGSALVVDDIIEETRGNKSLRSGMSRNQSSDYDEEKRSDDEDEYGSDEESVYSYRDRSRSPPRSRSRSPSRSLSPESSYRKSFSRSRSPSRSSRFSGRRSIDRRSRSRMDSDLGESTHRSDDEYSQ